MGIDRLIKIFLVVFISLCIVNLTYGESIKIKYNSSIYSDDRGSGLRLPEGVACNDNILLIADTGNSRLLKYTIENGVLKGGAEIKIPELTFPQRVEIGASNEIFIFDGKLRKIARLSPDGKFKSYLSFEGSVVPKSFKIDRFGNIYVLDIFNERVLVLNQEGNQIRSIEFPERYGFISDLAIDPIGNVFLLDSTLAVIYIASKESKSFSPFKNGLNDYINFPSNITIDAKGVIYLSDLAGGTISVIGQDGTFRGHQSGYGWKEGLLRYPSQICINDKGDFFVADRENNRVQMFIVIR